MTATISMPFAERAEKLTGALRTASRLVRFLDDEDLPEFLSYIQSMQDSPLTYAFVQAVKDAIDDPMSAGPLALCAAGPRASVPEEDPWGNDEMALDA